MQKTLRIPAAIALTVIFLAALVIAYGNLPDDSPLSINPRPTPTPTAVPTPTPTPTPMPTPTPTATPTPTPTATPTPEPTATPIPTPTSAPTATPTLEPEPTPTPELTLEEAAATAAQAVVKLTVGESVWTGTIISEKGEILTTSAALGQAPQAAFTLRDGTEGIAWVTGRSDDDGLALLTPIGETRDYDFIPLAANLPTIGQPLMLLQYDPNSGRLESRPTTARGYDTRLLGYGHVQLQISDNAAFDGAALVNTQAELQGVRMPSSWLTRKDIGDPGEVHAVSAADIDSSLVPQLRDGRTEIDRPQEDGEGPAGPPPQIPIVFLGSITLDGSPAPAGARLYAQVSKEGRPSLWFSGEVVSSGDYELTLSPLNVAAYSGATVEFWMNATAAPTTAEVVRGEQPVQLFKLAF